MWGFFFICFCFTGSQINYLIIKRNIPKVAEILSNGDFKAEHIAERVEDREDKEEDQSQESQQLEGCLEYGVSDNPPFAVTFLYVVQVSGKS